MDRQEPVPTGAQLSWCGRDELLLVPVTIVRKDNPRPRRDNGLIAGNLLLAVGRAGARPELVPTHYDSSRILAR